MSKKNFFDTVGDFFQGSDGSQFGESGQKTSDNIKSMSREDLLAADESLGDDFVETREKIREDQIKEHQNDSENPEDKELSMEEYASANGFFPLEYLVRGAQLQCPFGSHLRRLNLPLCHGVYITGRPMIHKLDSIPGDDENISTFGVCQAAGYKEALKAAGIKAKKVNLKINSYHDAESTATVNADMDDSEDTVQVGDATDEDLGNIRGLPCMPDIISPWMSTYDKTKIVENCSDADITNRSSNKEIVGEYLALESATTDSFLVCNYGGIIQVLSSGQGYIDAISDGYEEAQEKATEMAAAGVDTSKPVEFGGEDSPYGTDGDTSTAGEIPDTTPESDSESHLDERTEEATTEENGGATTVADPLKKPSREPMLMIQNRGFSCYATVAYYVALQRGAILPDIATAIDNYSPLQYPSNAVPSSLRSDFAGYNGEGDYYYCHPGQEYTVYLVKENAENEDPGLVQVAMEKLSGSYKYFQIKDASYDDLPEITLPAIAAAYQAPVEGSNSNYGDGHSLIVNGISKGSDGEIVLDMVDPWQGKSVVDKNAGTDRYDCAYNQVLTWGLYYYE